LKRILAKITFCKGLQYIW
jgi:TatD DNase family protein